MSLLPFGCVFSFDGLSIPERMSQNPHIFTDLKIFWTYPATSLRRFDLHKIIKTDITERGNDDGPYTVAYENPFTANYAGSFCTADTCKDKYRTIIYCPWRIDADCFWMHYQCNHQAYVAFHMHFDRYGRLSGHDICSCWDAGVFPRGNNYKSWTNNQILSAITTRFA